jgi:hypothetical protein
MRTSVVVVDSDVDDLAEFKSRALVVANQKCGSESAKHPYFISIFYS